MWSCVRVPQAAKPTQIEIYVISTIFIKHTENRLNLEYHLYKHYINRTVTAISWRIFSPLKTVHVVQDAGDFRSFDILKKKIGFRIWLSHLKPCRNHSQVRIKLYMNWWTSKAFISCVLHDLILSVSLNFCFRLIMLQNKQMHWEM